MRGTVILLVGLCWQWSGPVLCQPSQLSFSHLSISEGLTEGTNAFVYHDSRHYIWISSLDGLNRFDGKTVKKYRYNKWDSLSIAGNIITSNFFEDKEGDLWFTSYNSLNRYDRDLDHFERITLEDELSRPVSEDYYAFHLDSRDHLWIRTGIGTKGQLHLFNINSRIDSLSHALDGQRCSVIEDQQGRVRAVIATMFTRPGLELIRYSADGSPVTRSYFRSAQQPLVQAQIRNAHVESENEVYLSYSDGLILFAPGSGTAQYFNTFQDSVPVGEVWDIAAYQPDYLFVSTTHRGILVFDKVAQKFVRQFKANPASDNTLRDNRIRELYIDRNANLWASIWGKGIDFTNLEKRKFATLPDSIEVNNVYSIVTDPSGNTWASHDRGLLLLSPQLKVSQQLQFRPDVRNSLPAPGRFLLSQDVSGRIWYVASTQVGYYQHQSNRFFPIADNLTNLPHSLFELSNGRKLLCTDKGIFDIVNEGSDRSLELCAELSNYRGVFFTGAFEDRNGMVYFGKNAKSLLIYRNRGKQLEFIKEIPDIGRCYNFLEDEELVWLTTGSGLLWFDKSDTDHALTPRPVDHLPAEAFFGILADGSGNLWLSSNNGLLRYNPQTQQYRRFTVSDGLQGQQFGYYAAHLAADGRMWFGGSNGINVFHPDSIRLLPYLPGIQLTALEVKGDPWEGDKSIGELKILELPYTDNSLVLEFAALEYSDPTANQLKYKLTGHDDDWIFTTNPGSARYANLREGSYTFQVMGSNSDGVWNPQVRALRIRVFPPWHRSGWAYLLYFLLTVTIFYGIYRFQLNRRLIQAESRRLREVDELKTRLFTNITHEFRTPLTMILGPVDRSLRKQQPLATEELKAIQRNGRRLLRLVTQMLDLNKLEGGKMPLRYVQLEVVGFLKYLMEAFVSWSWQQQINLTFRTDVAELMMDTDKEKFSHIVSNLLSNALKFTEKGGQVSLSLDTIRDDDQPIAEISVSDTGIGMTPEELNHVFDRFYQADASLTRRREGSGIGLALTRELVELLEGKIEVDSQEGKGTRFTVRFPIRQQAVREIQEESIDEALVVSYGAHNGEIAVDPGIRSGPETPLILIVEDNPDVAAYIINIIGGAFRLDYAKNGKEGIDKAFEHVPDLIISDIMMPLVDGFELTEILKKDPRSSHIPIILLTSKGDMEFRIKGLEVGADVYLAKPFDEEELQLQIRNLLEVRRLLQHYYLQESGLQPVQPDKRPGTKAESEFVRKACKFINENLEDPGLKVDHLAQELNLSPSQLHRKLTALTGQSTGKLIRAHRVQKARSLVLQSELNFSEIAFRCGFNDPSYFARVFKEEFGITPSEMRNR